METYVCPWWLAYTFDHRLRNIIHNPLKMFGKYVMPGMSVLDIGCGLGFTTLGLAELVGDAGSVIALDIQQKMLAGTMKRAKRIGVEDRIQPILAKPNDLGLHTKVHFALAFFMVHEVPDPARFMAQVAACLLAGGRFMIVEPKIHVSQEGFEKTVSLAELSGLVLDERPTIMLSRAALLRRPMEKKE
jgi:ubiquinone/menaquinone biosynthesis C-methylase UbiE